MAARYKGHPFMTSTRRGGVRLRWTHADRGGVSPIWTSTQKIRAHSRHPVFFSCKDVGVVLEQNFAFGRNEKRKFCVNINQQYKLL